MGPSLGVIDEIVGVLQYGNPVATKGSKQFLMVYEFIYAWSSNWPPICNIFISVR